MPEREVMDPKRFILVATVIFGFVAVMHLLRIMGGWPVVLAGHDVPMWVSYIGLAIGGGLMAWGIRLTM
jgi:hypothetical protein